MLSSPVSPKFSSYRIAGMEAVPEPCLKQSPKGSQKRANEIYIAGLISLPVRMYRPDHLTNGSQNHRFSIIKPNLPSSSHHISNRSQIPSLITRMLPTSQSTMQDPPTTPPSSSTTPKAQRPSRYLTLPLLVLFILTLSLTIATLVGVSNTITLINFAPTTNYWLLPLWRKHSNSSTLTVALWTSVLIGLLDTMSMLTVMCVMVVSHVILDCVDALRRRRRRRRATNEHSFV